MELTDYLTKVPYLTEIPLCESTQELVHGGETRHEAFSLTMQKMFTASGKVSQKVHVCVKKILHTQT